jgi:hypothetical protein
MRNDTDSQRDVEAADRCDRRFAPCADRVLRFVGDQERDRFGDVGGLADVADRNAGVFARFVRVVAIADPGADEPTALTRIPNGARSSAAQIVR